MFSEFMQTRALQTLLAIRQSGGFAAAAEARNMTVSAVSMQIKALEEDLGVRLFDRTHRPPLLTPMGRQVCEQAGVIVNAEGRLRDLTRPQSGLRGQFRIGFVPTASVRLLPDFLIRSAELTPQASFHVETDLSASLEARVRSGTIDAAVITSGSQVAHDLEMHILRQEPLVYVRPIAHRDMPLLRMFATLRFFHFMPASGIGALIADHIGSRAHDVVLLDSVEAILECVARGLGFTLLPDPDVQRVADQRLDILNPNRPLVRELTLISKPGHNLTSHLAPLFETDC